MRWRIPLVFILAPFVAVSCDQQPTQPFQPETADATALFGSNGADHWNGDLEFGFPLCGYTYVDCQMKVRETSRSGTDASGGAHYMFHQVLHGTCTSEETGEEWRVTNDWHEVSQSQESGQEGSIVHYISAGVGKGHAPNFKARILCKQTINANGEMVIDDCSEFICEEFGS